MPTEALIWKLQGNTYCKDGKYIKAIERYINSHAVKPAF